MSGSIVHEWLEPHGGAEKVMEEIASIFPDATITCLWDDAPDRFIGRNVTESWMARSPLRGRKSLALPFMLPTWRHLAPADAEWILCSSHLFAHHAKMSGRHVQPPKYVYAYTPARYIWNPELDERGNTMMARVASIPLKHIDRTRAREARSIAAISNFVQTRIRNAWHRESHVIYPPVDVARFRDDKTSELNEVDSRILDRLPDTFVLGASRFIPYKRLDLAVKVGVAAGVPVVLAGSGPLQADLERLAHEFPGQVHIVTSPSIELLRALYKRAIAFVFPPVEDFGIMPVEAMATGTPVIGRDIGGSAETILDGTTGVLVRDFDSTNLKAALEQAASLSPEACVAQAERFDTQVFQTAMRGWINGGQ